MMYLFTDWSSVPRVTDELFDGFDNKNLPAENTLHKNVIRKIQRNINEKILHIAAVETYTHVSTDPPLNH